jgi:hypothetical protein
VHIPARSSLNASLAKFLNAIFLRPVTFFSQKIMRKIPGNCQKRRLTYESCVVGFNKQASSASSQLSVSKETFVALRRINLSIFFGKSFTAIIKVCKKNGEYTITGEWQKRMADNVRAWRCGDIPCYVSLDCC